jgi:TRAP-type C4-dicarboxylate transport system permease small subunit
MVWGGLLGASVAFYTRADPAVIEPSKHSRPRQRLQIVSRFIAAWGFFLPVLYYAWPFVLCQIDRPSEGLGVSTAWMASALPVAAFIICLHALAGQGTLFSPTLFDRAGWR